MNTPQTCTYPLHLLYLGQKWWFRVRCAASIRSPLTLIKVEGVAGSESAGGSAPVSTAEKSSFSGL